MAVTPQTSSDNAPPRPHRNAAEEGWHRFLALVGTQIPGCPERPTRDFDVTRHGVLDHFQRVALRALVSDLRPDLAPGAVEALRTLGEVADLVVDALDAAPEALAGRRDPLGTQRVRLVPLEPGHVGPLYRELVDPAQGFRWRYRGRTPSPVLFEVTLFDRVAVQLAAVDPSTGALLGVVVAYDEDATSRHCHVAFARCAGDGSRPGAMVEAMVLFVDHLFATFPFRRLFAELPEYNMALVEGLPPDLLAVEGRLRDVYWHGGRYWDRVHVAITRETWDDMAHRLGLR